MNIQLLGIDVQNDFCDPKGALYVTGANEDTNRLAKMIDKHGDKIDDIRVTLDSHQVIHIAHPIFWVDSKGNHPAPFTLIAEDDVVGPNAKWRAYNPAWQKRAVDYVKALKTGGRYVLVIWPQHCVIGSWGHGLAPAFSDSLVNWCKNNFGMIDFVTKGSNAFSEHYSVVRADVPDPSDPSTNINTTFIQRLEQADVILVAGQALSHCVRNSVTDILTEFGEQYANKFVILKDATSSVPGFEKLGEDFVRDMTKLGMQVSTTVDFFA